MAKKIKASDLRAPAKARISHELAAAHLSGTTWSDLGDQYSMSDRTARRWASTDMSQKSQHERHTQAGRPSKLTDDEAAEVLRLAKDRRNEHEVVDTQWTKETIAVVTQGRIPDASDALVSRFWRQSKWPLRQVQARTAREIRSTLQDEATEFQEKVVQYVHEHEIPPENIHIADETGMWNGSVALRTRVDPDTQDTGVKRHGDNHRDTGMVALSAAGGIDAYFLRHQPQITRREDGRTVILQRAIRGMGTDQMLEWSKGFVERREPEGESVLLLDHLGCHRNKKVLQTLEDGGVHTFLIPPQASKLISPCDNTFFASLKARLRQMNTATSEDKEAAFTTLCADYDPEIVRRYFTHCGWSF